MAGIIVGCGGGVGNSRYTSLRKSGALGLDVVHEQQG